MLWGGSVLSSFGPPSSEAKRARHYDELQKELHWARHMLDNREFVIGGGTQPSTEPIRAGGLDGSAAAEERDNYHRDAHMNDLLL